MITFKKYVSSIHDDDDDAETLLKSVDDLFLFLNLIEQDPGH